MKIKELKKMIKDAYLSEADFTSGQDDDAAPAIADDYNFLDEAEEEKSLDDILAGLMVEAEEEETDITVDAEEETTDSGEEKPANDSIVVDKKIVSLSSLPNDTRKILDSLETLRAQAEEFGDQKFITQVGNTITFFTRDFVVAGDEPTKAKVDEDYNPTEDKIKLTPGEIAVINDLTESINEGSIDLAKVKNYAKKGLMTLGVIATLLGGANLTLQQKQDVVDTVKTEIPSENQKDLQYISDAAIAHSLYLTHKADVEKLAETNSDVYLLIKDSKFQNFDKLDRVQDKITIGRSNQEAIKTIKAQSNLKEELNESLTFPLWNKIK